MSKRVAKPNTVILYGIMSDLVFRSVVLVLLTSILLVAMWFWWWNDQILSIRMTDWGAFGDFIGGVFNPIIALAILYYVTKSFRLQKEELNEMREIMKKQMEVSHEQTEEARRQVSESRQQTSIAAKSALLNSITNCLEYEKFSLDKLDETRVAAIDKGDKLSEASLSMRINEVIERMQLLRKQQIVTANELGMNLS